MTERLRTHASYLSNDKDVYAIERLVESYVIVPFEKDMKRGIYLEEDEYCSVSDFVTPHLKKDDDPSFLKDRLRLSQQGTILVV